MSQEMSDHLRKLSSRNGRYWLRDSRGSDAAADSMEIVESTFDNSNAELPFRSSTNRDVKTAGHESVVVSIPNVESSTAAKTKVYRDATSVGKTLGRNTKVVAPLPQITAPATPPSVEPPKRQRSTAVPQTQVPPPAEVPKPKMHRQQDDAVQASRAGQSQESKDSIAKIANKIISDYPVASSSLVMFTGSQVGLHTDESCARVAAELASRDLGRVLLIDSDFANRRLSKASGMSSQAGLSEVMNIAFHWEDAILKSGSSKLDFMSAGNCPHKRWTPIKTLKEALAEMRSKYQFICVSVGEAHDAAASTWASLADGTFLIVSATQSNDSIAESSVAQLRDDGARLVGCIVADMEASQA